MREILFRGKRINNGEWVTGFYVHYDDTKDNHKDDCDYIVGIHTGEHFPFFEVIPETVGQFTGLTDKNGKKIFEGDVVFCNSTYVNEMYYILFENLSFCYGELNNKYLTPIDDAEFGLYVSGCKLIGYEVIGNIHDNPEILEGGDEE